ncbi:hypothetical protein HAX54_048008 [Datura stramonium]|uniref:Uncharacterized protein n=1 Tax=Datura stramonium TaxID=4076 RepID=A0ABS8SV09_DATST|nr:hypothetical protein [Datura stramonium]
MRVRVKKLRSDGCSSEEAFDNQLQMNERLGYLYYQYFETCSPYGRVPLVDKISSLAERHRGLMSLRSVDLSPASWMSVAWYPIYHIPMGRTIKDLSTCFLTFHTLSSSFQDNTEKGIRNTTKRKQSHFHLFGLASYKMQGNVWILTRVEGPREDGVTIAAADSWLKQLGVQHHDFNFFLGIRHG